MMNATQESKQEKLYKLILEVNQSGVSSLKHTLLEIIRVINDPNASAKQLKDTIELDPPLSAKILKLANSAYYGAAREISEIQQAIVWLGFEIVKELALSQKVVELFENEKQIGDFNTRDLWKHSVAVGICGKLIYRREYRERGENIYAAGLLHNIGLIIEYQFRYPQFVEAQEKKSDLKDNLVTAERMIFGYDHSDLAGIIANDWSFPDDLVYSIGSHHNPIGIPQEYSRIAKTLFVADYLCQEERIGFCDSPNQRAQLFQTCLRDLTIKYKAVRFIIDEVKEEIHKMEEKGWF